MLIPSNTLEPNFTLETLFLNVVGTVVIFSPILYIWWRSSGEVTLNPMVSQDVKPKPVLSIIALAVVLPAALMPVDVLVDHFLTLLPDGISTAAQSINEQSNAIYIVQPVLQLHLCVLEDIILPSLKIFKVVIYTCLCLCLVPVETRES